MPVSETGKGIMKRRLLFLVCFWLLLPAVVGAEDLIRKGETLDLQRCIAIALERHPTIQSAAGTLVAGESRVGQARSGFYPQLNGFAGYSRINPTGTSAGTSSSQDYNSYSSSISLSQNLREMLEE